MKIVFTPHERLERLRQRIAAGGPGSGRYPKGSSGWGKETPNTSSGHNLEKGLADKIAADPEGAREYYNSLKNTEGGRVLNTDEARELSPEYRADRSRSAEVHEPASQFVKDLYTKKLSEPTPEGSIRTVLFTAGGTGAGKSSALRADPSNTAKQAEIIYDTNMNSAPSAQKKIDQALAAGRKVAVAYTYRDPVEALTGGALPRAMRMGRTVPLNEHLKTHVGAYNTIQSLQKTYANNPDVQFKIIDNSHGAGGARIVHSVDDLPKMADNGLEERLHNALESEFKAGRISKQVYDGTRVNSRRVESAGSRRSRQEPEQAGSGRKAAQVSAGGPGSGRYPKGSSGWGMGQQRTGRVFVSPNTKEGTNLDDAQKALNSERQKQFESKLKDIGTNVLGKADVHPAIGTWSDGAENSAELHTDSKDRDARRYAAALAGKLADQKAVLDWETDKNGPHTLHRVFATESADTLNRKIGDAGIEHRTVKASPDGKSSEAVILDQDGSLGDKVKSLVKGNGYRHVQGKGTGEFIGSWDSRDEGRAEYDKIINDFEHRHPGRSYVDRSGPLHSQAGRIAGTDGRGVRKGTQPHIRREPTGPPQAIIDRAKRMQPGEVLFCTGAPGCNPYITRFAGIARMGLTKTVDYPAWILDNRGVVIEQVQP